MEIQSVLSSKLSNSWFIATAPKIRTALCFLYKNIPKLKPVKNAVRVKPGKYGPMGNRIAPIKSANAATIPALRGPNIIAAITTGTKLNPIFMFQYEIEQKRDRHISVAASRLIIVKVLIVKFFSIQAFICVQPLPPHASPEPWKSPFRHRPAPE